MGILLSSAAVSCAAVTDDARIFFLIRVRQLCCLSASLCVGWCIYSFNWLSANTAASASASAAAAATAASLPHPLHPSDFYAAILLLHLINLFAHSNFESSIFVDFAFWNY
ncbi:hypothetical protein T08_2187 [Trichinella sp. T8]|nr:hypothetical protein T08_2187 [Trichinella sp. T8]